MWCDNTWKTTSIVLWKRSVTTCEDHIHCLLNVPWQHKENCIHCLMKWQWQHMEIHPLLIKCDVAIHGKQHPLFFQREQWQHLENCIYCLVNSSDNICKEIHPLLIKCALKTHGKQHPFFVEIEQWQHAENHIHCLVK